MNNNKAVKFPAMNSSRHESRHMDFAGAVNGFYGNLKKLETAIAASVAIVGDKKEALSRVLGWFINSSKTELEKLSRTSDEGLKVLISKNNDLLAEMLSVWAKELDNYIKVNNFVREFEDKFLVMVFGKVNSGKSTLGNIISGIKYSMTEKGSGQPGLRIDTLAAPEFFMYDRSNIKNHIDNLAELETEGFKVKETESTSSIQGFKLNALSWVDTPGIHSLTKENEDLAKKYISGADLVIYVMNSDSPAKASDMAEIELLIEKEINFMIVITKSDTTVEDEIDGKIVGAKIPKSAIDRNDQSQYCLAELNKLNYGDKLKNKSIIHTSYPLYETALKTKDSGLIEDSGYAELYAALHKIFSEEAVQIKAKSPAKRLNGFINTILTQKGGHNVYGIRKAFADNLAEIETSIARLEKLKGRIAGSAVFASDIEIDRIVNKCANEGLPADEMIAMAEAVVGNAIKTAATPVIENEIKSFNKQYAENFKTNMCETGIDFEQRYAEYTYNETTHVTFYSTGGSILGAIAGYMIGGPIGAIAGSMAGSLIGNAIGECDVRVKTGRVHTGDNRDEVIAAVKERARAAIYEACNAIVNNVKNDYYANLKKSVETILTNIERLVIKINELKIK